MCTNEAIDHFFEDITRKMLPRGHHIRLQVLGSTFGKKNLVRILQNISSSLESNIFNHVANLINVTCGMTIGWFMVYANQFHTENTPLGVPPLDHSEVNWMYASFYMGTLIGLVLLTLCGDAFGRKNTLVVLLIPQAVNSYFFVWGTYQAVLKMI